MILKTKHALATRISLLTSLSEVLWYALNRKILTSLAIHATITVRSDFFYRKSILYAGA